MDIVAIHQLPRTPETLQKRAIDELETLPTNYPFQQATLKLLYNLQQTLKINKSSEPEDKELIMRLAQFYQRDKEEARLEGEQKGEERLVLRQLNRRFGEIKLSLIEQIQSLSIEQLENLADALLDFSQVADLETWLKQQKPQ